MQRLKKKRKQKPVFCLTTSVQKPVSPLTTSILKKKIWNRSLGGRLLLECRPPPWRHDPQKKIQRTHIYNLLVKMTQIYKKAPFIFTCDIYYEIIALNILIVFFSLFSFPHTKAWTRHGIVCICSNYHFFYEIVSCNVVWLCQKKWLVV